MIHLVAFIHIKEGRLPEFLDIFKSIVPKVREEKGCIEYVPTIDIPAGFLPQELNKHVVTVIEKWDRLEDLQAHISAPHILDYQEKAEGLIEKLIIKVLKEA